MDINGTDYQLVLFDTNALSNLLQNPGKWLSYIHDKIRNSLICYSVFTLSELWFRQELFEKYLEIFSIYPSVILDSHDSIFIKERDGYYTNNPINPIVVAPTAIKDDTYSPKEKLKYIITHSGFIEKTNGWKKNQRDILEGILSLKNNFLPKNGKYSVSDIELFNFTVTTKQIGLRDLAFTQKIINTGKEIDLKKFLSLQTSSYVVFYKFYMGNRKPTNSDIFDIIISSITPYVDYFITENNLTNIIKQIQARHGFLTHLSVISLKEILNELPT